MKRVNAGYGISDSGNHKKTPPLQVRLLDIRKYLKCGENVCRKFGGYAGYYSDQNSNDCQYQQYVDKVTHCFAKSYIAN